MVFKNIKSADDLAAEKLAQENDQKVVEAKKYLLDTDFYFTVDKYSTLTDERKLELETKRETARQLVNSLEN